MIFFKYKGKDVVAFSYREACDLIDQINIEERFDFKKIFEACDGVSDVREVK